MQPFDLPPGVFSTPTRASKSAYWRDSNLMRWDGGKMRPFDGWSRTTYAPTASPIRRVYEWRGINGQPWRALLCDSHLYVDREGQLFDITPDGGMAPPSYNVGGYGDHEYSGGEYGTERPPSTREILNSTFTLSNWGEDLVAMTSADGRLLIWSPRTPDNKAVAVSNAPIACRGFVVTPERFVIVYDPNGEKGQFAWCDRENIEGWNFADPLGQSGILPVFPSAAHHSAIDVPGGVLTFSQQIAYVVRFIGAPLFHGFDIIDNTGNVPLSDRSVVSYPNGAIWMAKSGAWIFDGVGVRPIECPVWTWFEKECDMDLSKFLASAVHLPSKSEILFFFPSKNSQKNNRYVIYNYVEGWWGVGRLSRSAGISSTYYSSPLMADDNILYAHDGSASYPGAIELPWVESHSLMSHVADTTIMFIEPDLEGMFDDVRFSLRYRNALSGGKEIVTPKRRMFNNRVEFMVAAKECRIRIESVSPNYKNWTLGNSGIQMAMEGRK